MGLKKGILFDLAMLVVLGIVGIAYLTIQETKSVETPNITPTPSSITTRAISPTMTTLANPASVNCSHLGGTLIIQKRGNGGEYGLCQFGDNQACEEWALFRKECPVGGIKTTGYSTLAQKYCAWVGGKTTTDMQATCTLPNGNVCDDEALYKGLCQ